MNPDPQAKRILCFGDSNTWGRSGASIKRYPVGVRWTGLLQTKLGTDYELIEEGLRSRTTNIDDDDPKFPHRNGLEYLRPCLESHAHLDLVILWIGTNDLKARFKRSAVDVTAAVLELILIIKRVSKKKNGAPSEILLIAPPLVREEALKPHTQFAGAGEKSAQFGGLYKNLATAENINFFDISPYVQAGELDGVHLEPAMHPIVTEQMYNQIKMKGQVNEKSSLY